MLGEGGESYSIVDMIIWAWYGQLVLDKLYKNGAEFLDASSYTNVQRWDKQILNRPAVQRAIELELKSTN